MFQQFDSVRLCICSGEWMMQGPSACGSRAPTPKWRLGPTRFHVIIGRMAAKIGLLDTAYWGGVSRAASW